MKNNKSPFHINIRFFRSLRFGIILLLMIVGIVPCIIGYFSIINAYEARAISLRTEELRNQASIFCEQLIMTNYLETMTSDLIESRVTSLEKIYDGQVLVLTSGFDVVISSHATVPLIYMYQDEIVRSLEGEHIEFVDTQRHSIVIALPIIATQNRQADVPVELDIRGTIIGTVVVTASTKPIQESILIFQDRGIFILTATVGLILAASIIISYFIVRPIRKITVSIEGVSEGYDDEVLHVNTYTETQLLSEAFNKMLGRLKKIDDSRQEFVSNVSHELKTPLTSMKVLADSLVAMPDAPVELYREFMCDIALEIDRENEIINDLLALVKMDKSAQTLTIHTININNLIETILKRLKPIADQKNIELVLDSFQPVLAEIDEVKMTLAVSNLIENAVKYNRNDGWVHITLNSDQKYFYITVSDSGMGIPQEDQDQIFERFYRVDKSHSREISGTGLGLSIARNAIISHRGSIKLHSAPGEGSTFTLRVPLVYRAIT